MFRIKKRSRFDYWSCSKFANWIRGTAKPMALSLEDWDSWRIDAKQKQPYRYWLAEQGLSFLQDFVNLPIDIYHTIDIYIQNRFISKIQYLKTGLKPGEYYDLDHRILHGLFNELIDFVEIQQAGSMAYDKEKKYKFKNRRCVEAGLDYLKWAGSLTYDVSKKDKLYGQLTHQAKSAQKILELYNWWKNRDNRVDPHDLYSKEKDGKFYFRKIDKMENEYDKEDTKMLIELIKIRTCLWN